jgi:chromosome partitioning protein
MSQKIEVIAIINQKGGVGKTTTSVNLSASLANKGKKVLLIDLDPQGHAGEHLGCRQGESDNGALGVIQGKIEIIKAFQKSYNPKLMVLPSNLLLGKFNQLDPAPNQFNLREAISKVDPSLFDYIIIDCQPSLSLLTLNALTASTQVILPVQAEFLALDGMIQLIKTLVEVRVKLHPKLHILGILLTMFDARNKLSSEVHNELQKNFGDELFDTIIPRNVALAEAPSFGKSIFEYNSSCNGAKAYLAMTNEVIKRAKKS